MNQKDREEIRKQIEIIQNAHTAIVGAREAIEGYASAEREKFDNLTEGLQQSEMGQNIEQCADNLESWDSTIEDVLDDLETAISEIEEALG